MSAAREHDGAWSRAVLATSGLPVRVEGEIRHATPDARESGRDELARERVVQLSASREAAVRETIAARADAPLGVLISLAHDGRAGVRIAVAANPASVRAILEHLASDRDLAVVVAVARNESTPRDILERLAFDRRPEVRRVAAKRLNGPVAETVHAAAPKARAPEIDERSQPAASGSRPTPAGNRPVAPRNREVPVLAPRPKVPAREVLTEGSRAQVGELAGTGRDAQTFSSTDG